MQPEPQPLPPPGWYANGPGLERWWDGRQWGPQTRALQVQVPQMPRMAVTRQPRRTSHLFHLVMSLITFGLWLPVWALVAILNKVSRDKVVTRYR